MPTSDQLLALMQAGDLLALDALARAYSDKLLAVARRQCHLAADAEDAVQQALLVASAAMTGIRDDGAPLAWLSTLVARSCFRLNAQARRVGDEVPEEGCDDPTEQYERRELAGRLEGALMALQRTDRLLILLSVEGFTSVELAEQFGLSHDAVRSRLKRARQTLRDTLDDGRSTEAANPHPGASPHASPLQGNR
jgi:RNA polymerase sigma-70 factor (ECF subfamily)